MHWATDALILSLRGIVASYLARRSHSVWTRMGEIKAPTLVVWGTRDRLVDPSLAPRVAATIPDARLLVLDEIGHVAMLEDPVTTARAALGLLEDVRTNALRRDATPQTPPIR